MCSRVGSSTAIGPWSCHRRWLSSTMLRGGDRMLGVAMFVQFLVPVALIVVVVLIFVAARGSMGGEWRARRDERRLARAERRSCAGERSFIEAESTGHGQLSSAMTHTTNS